MASSGTPQGMKASSPERRPQQAGSYKTVFAAPKHRHTTNPCRSWLASDGVLRSAAGFEGLIASKPAPTGPCSQRCSNCTPQNHCRSWLASDGVLRRAAGHEGLIAGKPAPTRPCSQLRSICTPQIPVRSWLASDGVLRSAAGHEGLIAGKPAPTGPCFHAVAVANAGHKTDLNQPEWHGNTQGDGRLSCVWLCSHRFAFANH
ncbi:hypothetical protein J2Y74_002409 [Pseudomonas migulae]|nr:hypothetical protein [Pseudomonas migulae]